MSLILVTGGTGTIGRKLTEQLLKDGADVRLGVHSIQKAEEFRKLGAATFEFDFAKPATVESACRGVDRMFLLSPFVEDFETGVRTAVAAARKAGVKHVVRSSAVGADSKSGFALAAQHGRCDNIVKSSGMGWTILQPTFFQDNFVNFAAPAIKSGGVFYGASGTGRTSYVSAADIASCAARILGDPSSHNGKTYVLTGPEAVGDEGVAAALSRILGKTVRYVDLSPDALGAGMKSHGMPAWMVTAMIGLEGVKAAGWAAGVSPDVRQILGRPGETIGAFLERNRAAFA